MGARRPRPDRQATRARPRRRARRRGARGTRAPERDGGPQTACYHHLVRDKGHETEQTLSVALPRPAGRASVPPEGRHRRTQVASVCADGEDLARHFAFPAPKGPWRVNVSPHTRAGTPSASAHSDAETASQRSLIARPPLGLSGRRLPPMLQARIDALSGVSFTALVDPRPSRLEAACDGTAATATPHVASADCSCSSSPVLGCGRAPTGGRVPGRRQRTLLTGARFSHFRWAYHYGSLSFSASSLLQDA